MAYVVSRTVTPSKLRDDGPLVPASWTHPSTRDIAALGDVDSLMLVDTGSAGLMIDEAVARELDMPTTGSDTIHGVHGNANSNKYRAILILPSVGPKGRAMHFGAAV